jgi:hypothetical protein
VGGMVFICRGGPVLVVCNLWKDSWGITLRKKMNNKTNKNSKKKKKIRCAGFALCLLGETLEW